MLACPLSLSVTFFPFIVIVIMTTIHAKKNKSRYYPMYYLCVVPSYWFRLFLLLLIPITFIHGLYGKNPTNVYIFTTSTIFIVISGVISYMLSGVRRRGKEEIWEFPGNILEHPFDSRPGRFVYHFFYDMAAFFFTIGGCIAGDMILIS